MKSREFTNYHIGALILYFVLMLYLGSSYPGLFKYEASVMGLVWTLIIFLISLCVYLLLNPIFKFGKIGFRSLPFWQYAGFSLIAVLFAIPEEVIYRGLLQTEIGQFIHNDFLAILTTSIIFATAHLPNGAKGWRINDWNWEFFVLAFIGGLALGACYLATGNLFYPTLLHVIFLLCLRMFRVR